MDMQEQLKESEVTKTSEKLKSFCLVMDEVKYGRKSISEIDSIVSTVKKEKNNIAYLIYTKKIVNFAKIFM